MNRLPRGEGALSSRRSRADRVGRERDWITRRVPGRRDDPSARHGGHFFGTAHTLERYERAFYAPLLSDWDNYDNWEDRGSPDAAVRANRIWKQLLAEYQPPAIDPAVDEALRDYVARRKREIHAAGPAAACFALAALGKVQFCIRLPLDKGGRRAVPGGGDLRRQIIPTANPKVLSSKSHPIAYRHRLTCAS